MGRDTQPPDRTLADAAWLQRFARSLVHSADLADDLCQDTWLANLKRGEPTSRSWLARVVRNLAISLLRRNTRRKNAERSGDDQDLSPDTAVVVAEAEIQRKAVDALMELPEPYRSTLLLRFMKGLSYKDVAKQTRVPIETVRTRIKRGLSQLRQKLDQEHGGRRAWLPPLVLPSLGIGTAALWGIVLMNIQTKLMLAGTGLAAALLTIWFVAQSPPSASAPIPPQEDITPLAASLDESEIGTEPVERQQLETTSVRDPETGEQLASLLVRLTWHDTKEPAEGLPLHFERGSVLGHTKTTVEPPREASTGEDGTFLFEDLRPGSYRLCTNRPFYGAGGSFQMDDAFDLQPGETKILEHEIHSGVDLRGQVVDRHGRGVAGAQLLTSFAGFIPQRTLTLGKTDETGSFFIRAINTAHLLGAQAEGLGTSDFVLVNSLDRAPDRPSEVILRLPDAAPSQLSGMVLDPVGQPVRTARVTVGEGFFGGRFKMPDDHEGQLPPRIHLYTDDEGSFSVRDLRPGLTPIHVYAPGHAPWSTEMEIPPSQAVEMRVDLQVGGSISGRVRDATGMPLRDVAVRVEPSNYPYTGGYVHTDLQGRYEIRDLPPSEIEVIVALPRNYVPSKRKFNLAGPEDIEWDVTLETGQAITGILRDHRGQPLQRWRIEWGHPYNVGAYTDSEGRFAVDGAAQRGHTLQIFMDPRSYTSSAVMQFEDIWPGEHDLTVPESALPSAFVEGRVLMPDGQPATEARIWLEFNRTRRGPRAEPDAEGHFEIGPVPPGDYTLDASLRGMVDAEFGELTLAPRQRLDLGTRTLREGGHLTVSIDSSSELAGLAVVLLDLTEDRMVRTGSVNGDRAVFRLVPKGTYRLSVSRPGGAPHIQRVEILPGETLEVTVTLR